MNFAVEKIPLEILAAPDSLELDALHDILALLLRGKSSKDQILKI
jgi:hypothetical protein